MTPSSRTPEGRPNRCRVCGNELRIEPSLGGDATCPNCGSLVWFRASTPGTSSLDYFNLPGFRQCWTMRHLFLWIVLLMTGTFGIGLGLLVGIWNYFLPSTNFGDYRDFLAVFPIGPIGVAIVSTATLFPHRKELAKVGDPASISVVEWCRILDTGRRG